ncbi:hypothetical protein F5Y04DRAFT_290559 [Hypomontagnella monticulosa]|nr:hypothetical protein F5Y04DRAFT_290559 [Hypomontagnella monticulosa]
MSPKSEAISRAVAAVDLLKDALPARVITTNAASEYESQRSRPWSQTCWESAAAYVQPVNTQEVAQALSIITKAGSKFAIRTTGHIPNPGFSSVGDTGVVIDLRKLQSLSLDKENGILRTGAGCTWGEVYSYLEENNLSAIGGRDVAVGVAGFLLGGGYSAFPNLHGTGVDGVRGFEVVLADSTIVTANAETNIELYRALKGGGSNFGIVTRFDISVYPLIETQTTINLYNPSDYLNILDATVKVQDAMEKDPGLNAFTNFNAGFVAVVLLSANRQAEGTREFEPFDKLQSKINQALPTTNGTLLSIANFLKHSAEPGKRLVGSATTKVSHELYVGVYKCYLDVISKLPSNITLHYTIQPVSTAGIQAGEDRGGNIMGLEKLPQCWWVFTAEWPEDGDDAAAQQAINTMTQNTRNIARDKGLLLDYLSMNFANSSQDVLRSYGAENVRRMQETAAKYDPEGVFQKLQNGGFLLRDL